MSGLLRYPIVIFDLDGTLVDSYEALHDAINRTLAGEGLPTLAPGEVRNYVGEGVERLLQQAMRTDAVPDHALERFERYYGEVCCEGSVLLAGVGETLERLHRLGTSMAVCTNKPTGFSVRILEHLGIAPLFAGIAGPDVAGARKPDPRHVRYALELVPPPRGAALLAGDMPIDVRAARAAAIDVAVIATGSSSVADLREAGPDYVLDRFEEIEAVVCGAGVGAR